MTVFLYDNYSQTHQLYSNHFIVIYIAIGLISTCDAHTIYVDHGLCIVHETTSVVCATYFNTCALQALVML